MALKQLMIAKKIEQRKASLAELLTKDDELKTRGAALETALEESKTDEEIANVDEEVVKLDAEQEELDKKKGDLEGEIAALEGELEQLKSKEPSGSPKAEATKRTKIIGGDEKVNTRKKFFAGMNRAEVDSFVARDDVKEFLTRTRDLIGQKRSVTGAELTIPEVMLDLLRDNLNRYSKLIGKVNLKPVGGKARQNISAAVPEAVWTEAVASLNELNWVLGQMEVDGYKVGGFIPIPNSTLEDSDLALANEILDVLGQAIGYAIDKSILYGTGVKMPIGIATRLAQAAQPANWGANRPTWVDLRATHLITINPAGLTPAQFFAQLAQGMSRARANYATGQKWWAMNTNTWTSLMVQTINFNAAGALVAAANNTMPIIGGDIIIEEFMPDNDIIGGYGSLYLLAERAGAQLAASEHARFVEDQTVFRGTARYDGQPVFGESFVAININNAAPTTVVLFPQDVANTVATPKALPIGGQYAAAVDVSLFCDTVGAAIYYTVDGSDPDETDTLYNGPIPVAADTTIKAIAFKAGMTKSAILTATYDLP